jgi:broad specificity phosphatase PhoE
MKKVYLVRHGESEANVGNMYLGGETPLTAKGHEQAEFIAERASKLPIEIIIASTLLRAKQTAQHIVEKTGKPIEFSDLFVERRSPSEYIGRKYNDPATADVDKLLDANFGKPGWRYSDEENFDDMKVRAKKAMQLLESRPENEILVVTHGLFLRMLVGTLVFGDEFTGREGLRLFKAFKTKNTGLTVFELDLEDERFGGQWRMLTWNDHAHLAD